MSAKAAIGLARQVERDRRLTQFIQVMSGQSRALDRVLEHLQPPRYIAADPRRERGARSLKAMREKEGRIPGRLFGGKGQLEIPLSVRFGDVESFHDRGLFQPHVYDMIIDGKIVSCTPDAVVLDEVRHVPTFIHWKRHFEAVERPPLPPRLEAAKQHILEHMDGDASSLAAAVASLAEAEDAEDAAAHFPFSPP